MHVVIKEVSRPVSMQILAMASFMLVPGKARITGYECFEVPAPSYGFRGSLTVQRFAVLHCFPRWTLGFGRERNHIWGYSSAVTWRYNKNYDHL